MFNVHVNGKETNFRSATRVYDYVSRVASVDGGEQDYSDPAILRDGAPITWNDLTRLMKFEASHPINNNK